MLGRLADSDAARPGNRSVLHHPLDSTRLGPAAGGTRAAQYASLGEALDDAGRLAGAMTLKWRQRTSRWASASRSLLSGSAPRDRPGTWKRILTLHAETSTHSRGNYWTGPDVNTDSSDMDVSTTQPSSSSAAPPRVAEPVPCIQQSLDVFEAIKATAMHRGTRDARRSHRACSGPRRRRRRTGRPPRSRARLLVSDTDPEQLAWARQLGHAVVGTDDVPDHAH